MPHRRTAPAIATLGLSLLLALGAASTTTGAQSFDMEAVERGRVVYDVSAGGVGCAMCHAPFATGDIGPDVRGMTAADVGDALGNIPDMEFISLSDADLDAVGAYLEWLGFHTPQLVGLTGGAFKTPEISVKVGVPVQLIFENGDAADYALTSDLWTDAVAVPNKGVAAVELTPEATGSFAVA
jgi:mono/diheme cytochrome c family protein